MPKNVSRKAASAIRERPETTSFRWNADDWRLLAALMKKTGLTSSAEVLRMGLRTLAEKEGLH